MNQCDIMKYYLFKANTNITHKPGSMLSLHCVHIVPSGASNSLSVIVEVIIDESCSAKYREQYLPKVMSSSCNTTGAISFDVLADASLAVATVDLTVCAVSLDTALAVAAADTVSIIFFTCSN